MVKEEVLVVNQCELCANYVKVGSLKEIILEYSRKNPTGYSTQKKMVCHQCWVKIKGALET